MLPVLCPQVGVTGNAVILYVLFQHPKLRSRVNLFIGNLAVADLLIAALCPTLFTMEDLYQSYIMGPIGCRLQGFIQSEAPELEALGDYS